MCDTNRASVSPDKESKWERNQSYISPTKTLTSISSNSVRNQSFSSPTKRLTNKSSRLSPMSDESIDIDAEMRDMLGDSYEFDKTAQNLDNYTHTEISQESQTSLDKQTTNRQQPTNTESEERNPIVSEKQPEVQSEDSNDSIDISDVMGEMLD